MSALHQNTPVRVSLQLGAGITNTTTKSTDFQLTFLAVMSYIPDFDNLTQGAYELGQEDSPDIVPEN